MALPRTLPVSPTRTVTPCAAAPPLAKTPSRAAPTISPATAISSAPVPLCVAWMPVPLPKTLLEKISRLAPSGPLTALMPSPLRPVTEPVAVILSVPAPRLLARIPKDPPEVSAVDISRLPPLPVADTPTPWVAETDPAALIVRLPRGLSARIPVALPRTLPVSCTRTVTPCAAVPALANTPSRAAPTVSPTTAISSAPVPL